MDAAGGGRKRCRPLDSRVNPLRRQLFCSYSQFVTKQPTISSRPALPAHAPLLGAGYPSLRDAGHPSLLGGLLLLLRPARR
jgi:hypothetical protein